MLGHELRNPLSPILTALQLMRLRGVDARRARAHDHRAAGEAPRRPGGRPARRLAHHAGQDRAEEASTSSWPTSSRTPSRWPAPCSRSASTRSTSTCRRQRLLVRRATRTRLAQVVANLLTNAAKYTEPGGSIEVSARPRRRTTRRHQRARHRHRHRPGDAAARSSTCSRRTARRWIARRAAWGWAWPSSAAWSRCTAARSPSTARGGAGAARSPCACRMFRCRSPRAARTPARRSRRDRQGRSRPGRGRQSRLRRRCWRECCRSWIHDAGRLRRSGSTRGRAERRPRCGVARRRATRDERLRAGQAASGYRRVRADLPDRGDRLRATARSPGVRGDAGFDAHLVKPVDLEQLAHVVATLAKGRSDGRSPTAESHGRSRTHTPLLEPGDLECVADRAARVVDAQNARLVRLHGELTDLTVGRIGFAEPDDPLLVAAVRVEERDCARMVPGTRGTRVKSAVTRYLPGVRLVV